MKSQKISIGVIGVGHLGQHHVKHYSNMNNINLLGVHDTDSVRGKKIATIYDTKYFEKANELMQKCDAISIVTPTEFHYDCLLYTSPSPRDGLLSRMPSSA